MYTVVGYSRSQGVYNNFPYDNVILHVTTPISSKNGEGVACSAIKIKASLLDSVPELGSEIEPLFDRYRNCIFIKLKKE